MKDNTFFKQTTIEKFKKAHNILLWVATITIIISLVLGAILIFADNNSDVFGKIQGTFWLLTAVSFISVNNLIRIEKGNKLIQCSALTGLVFNIVWLIMGVLLVWGAFSPLEYSSSTKRNTVGISTYETYDLYDYYDDDYVYDYDDFDYDEDYDDDYYYDDDSITTGSSYSLMPTSSVVGLSVAAKIAIVAASIASAGFWISNVLAIKEKVKAIKPLKITAIVCQIYCCIFTVALAFISFSSYDKILLKFAALAGLASLAFVVTSLAAWIISRTHKESDIPAPVKIKETIKTTESIVEIKEPESDDEDMI